VAGHGRAGWAGDNLFAVGPMIEID